MSRISAVYCVYRPRRSRRRQQCGGPCRSLLSISPAAGTWRYLAVRLHDRAVAALQLYLQVPDAPVRALAATGWLVSNQVCASRGASMEEGQSVDHLRRGLASIRCERSGWDAVVSDEWSRSISHSEYDTPIIVAGPCPARVQHIIHGPGGVTSRIDRRKGGEESSTKVKARNRDWVDESILVPWDLDWMIRHACLGTIYIHILENMATDHIRISHRLQIKKGSRVGNERDRKVCMETRRRHGDHQRASRWPAGPEGLCAVKEDAVYDTREL